MTQTSGTSRLTLLERLGRYEDALAGHEKVLSLRLDYNAFKARSRLFTMLGRNAEAAYEDGVYWLVLSGTADHPSQLKSELGKALECFDEATSLDREFADAWYRKGLVLVQLDRHEEAQSALDEVLRLRPDDGEARRTRSTLQTPAGRHTQKS
jgi:tetratricopeptide (TPR) repeat protein